MLTLCQLNAIEALKKLYFDDKNRFLVIEGPAGTGKTTLLKHFIHQELAGLEAKAKLVMEPPKTVRLTATTNKAAEALTTATYSKATTVHKALGIMISNGKPKYPYGASTRANDILVIDEFSYLDDELLDYILKVTNHKKTRVVFMGDPNQLPPVTQKHLAIDKHNFPRVQLKEVVRQESQALKDMADSFRDFVVKGTLPVLDPNGVDIIYYEDSDKGEAEFIENMKRAYATTSSKFISYKNARAQEINQFFMNEVKKRALPQTGDYMVVNKHYTNPNTMQRLVTDSVVRVSITGDVLNRIIKTAEGKLSVDYMVLKANGIKVNYAINFEDYVLMQGLNKDNLLKSDTQFIEEFCDLRAEFACTVHKSQGSSYSEVFIDLSDFSSIRDNNLLARLLYVAVSRVRSKLHVIGDL